MRSFFYSVLRVAAVSAATQCFFDFLVGFVLAQGIDRPDRCWHPADQCDLQKQAQQARKRAKAKQAAGAWQNVVKIRKSRQRRPQSSTRQLNRGCLGSSRRQGMQSAMELAPGQMSCAVYTCGTWRRAWVKAASCPPRLCTRCTSSANIQLPSSTYITGQPKAALASKHKRGNERFS